MLIFSLAQNHKHLQINKEHRRRKKSHKRSELEPKPRVAPDTLAVAAWRGLHEDWPGFPLF